MSAEWRGLREQWLRGIYTRQMYTLPPMTLGECIETYRGQPITREWPTEVMMRVDLAEWVRESEGRKDVSADSTFDGWIQCADGRTLWEFAQGAPR